MKKAGYSDILRHSELKKLSEVNRVVDPNIPCREA